MKGSINKYCACADPATGRQYGAQCPKWSTESKHGRWEYRDRLPTTVVRDRTFRRRRFATKKAAEAFRDQVHELLALARGDGQSMARIGDQARRNRTPIG